MHRKKQDRRREMRRGKEENRKDEKLQLSKHIFKELETSVFPTMTERIPCMQISNKAHPALFLYGSFCFSFGFDSPSLFFFLEINYIDGRFPLLHRACYSSSYILYASSERKGCGVTDPNYLKGSGLDFRAVSDEERLRCRTEKHIYA